MYLRAFQSGSSTLFRSVNFIQWNVKLRLSNFGQAVCQFTGGTAWRVYFTGMCIIDDLSVGDISGSDLSEFLQEHHSQGEVSHCKNPALNFLCNIIDLLVISFEDTPGKRRASPSCGPGQAIF